MPTDACRNSSSPVQRLLRGGLCALCGLTFSGTIFAESEETPPSERSWTPAEAPRVPDKARETRTRISPASGKTNRKGRSFALGAGLVTPPTRPAASVGIASPWGPLQVAVRATASYAGLTSSFATAAKNSEYANRISNTSASLWDLDITLPELTLSLPWSTYVSATTNVRSTRCVANFTTVKNEALDFTGWALSVGVGAAIAYRLSLGDQPLAFDFFTGVGMPLTSLGWTDLAFKRTVSTTSETFSEADLVSMLDSLQPYVQDISKQPTIEAGARATWRF